ncbi:MAG: hypothetical protein IJN31_03440 [Peptococcaceae bacterium]|nr:hypothetical protein [Clostridia bacterium]MBQ7025637.1 hypothetical protein [Peptococcaceae bacterium]
MKNSTKVALGGIIAALSIVVMLMAYFPYLTYALPAIAGCLLVIIVVEMGVKSAFAVFLAVGILSFFICEKEASVLYLLFFGYYPIIKSYLERIKSRVAEWVLKFLIFNVGFSLAFVITTSVLLIDVDMMGDFGKYGFLVLLGLGNVVFGIYDVAVTRLISVYFASFRNKIKKLIK